MEIRKNERYFCFKNEDTKKIENESVDAYGDRMAADPNVVLKILDIVADTVKIGLGALIGGTFAIWTQKLSSKDRLRESFVLSRRERLTEISREFARIHNMILHNWISEHGAGEVTQSEEEKQALLEIMQEANDCTDMDAAGATARLHELEAEMCLLGAPELAQLMENYRIELTELVSDEDKSPEAYKAKFAKFEKEVMPQRTNILLLMSILYRSEN